MRKNENSPSGGGKENGDEQRLERVPGDFGSDRIEKSGDQSRKKETEKQSKKGTDKGVAGGKVYDERR